MQKYIHTSLTLTSRNIDIDGTKRQNAKMPKCKLHPSLDISSRPVKRRVYNRREPAPGYPHTNHHHHITSSFSTVDLLLSCIQNHSKAPKEEISATTHQNNIISNQEIEST
jgi:hypothetical protein